MGAWHALTSKFSGVLRTGEWILSNWRPFFAIFDDSHDLTTDDRTDVNSKDTSYSRTPLWLAAERGDEAVVKLLLETGKADVDSKDRYDGGRTPLWWAVERGYETVVKLLLETGKA